MHEDLFSAKQRKGGETAAMKAQVEGEANAVEETNKAEEAERDKRRWASYGVNERGLSFDQFSTLLEDET